LWKVGICLNLGHRGAQCPGYQHPRSQFGDYENDFGNAGEDEEEPEGVGWANPGRPSPAEADGLKVVTIIRLSTVRARGPWPEGRPGPALEGRGQGHNFEDRPSN
jgi:hypothetical protein